MWPMIKFYFSKNRTLRRVLSCEFTENVQNSFLRLILNFPKLEYNWIFITFYAVVLEYAFTSRTGWKENENEIGYVYTTGHNGWIIACHCRESAQVNGLWRTKKEGGLSGQPKSGSYVFKRNLLWIFLFIDLLVTLLAPSQSVFWKRYDRFLYECSKKFKWKEI